MRDITIGAFLEQLGSRTPAPGGGAAAALQAAQAAALLAMVTRYSTSGDDTERLGRIVDEADGLTRHGLIVADADATAFRAVADAYGLPKHTDEEKAARRSAISQALTEAARPPTATIEASRRVIELAEEVLPFGNRNVIGDLAAAVQAARAAATTSRINVEANVRGAPAGTREELLAVAAGVDELVARSERVTAAVRQRMSE